MSVPLRVAVANITPAEFAALAQADGLADSPAYQAYEPY